jgi:diguanylate cyclase (GGDEF)-like protein
MQQLSESNTAEILLWQSRLRFYISVGIGLSAILLRLFGWMSGDWRYVAATLSAYLIVIGGLYLIIKRRERAGRVVIGATILADLGMIFGTSALVTEPDYYERTLFLSLCTIQFSQFYFGRGAAWLAVSATVVGYSTLASTAIIGGAGLLWMQELWALGSFLLAATAFIFIHGNFRERLTRIARLFERAESGDFNTPWVASARSYPDAIAMLGASYNRVRHQLAEMVLTDPLSGCLNRRGFDQQLARELARCSRSGRPISLLAIDIDHFKVVNDTFGHLAGDAVIREVGQLLRESGRGGDVVARMGGEEFMVLAPDTDAQGALQLGDRLCLAFRHREFKGLGTVVRVTASVGVVAEDTCSEQHAADLRGRADEALYTAKQTGRDQVVLWKQGMRPFRDSPAEAMQKFSE